MLYGDVKSNCDNSWSSVYEYYYVHFIRLLLFCNKETGIFWNKFIENKKRLEKFIRCGFLIVRILNNETKYLTQGHTFFLCKLFVLSQFERTYASLIYQQKFQK